MLFRDVDHSLDALREERVVGVDDLAVPRSTGDHAQSSVPVGYDGQKLSTLRQPYSCVAFGIRADDVGSAVSTAVVDDDVFPPVVGLGDHALNTIGQILLAVVDRRYDPYERTVAQSLAASAGV
jgi:hypothetical protein